MNEINIIDFRLQAFKEEIIITILVDNTPLYDCIICQHVQFGFTERGIAKK